MPSVTTAPTTVYSSKGEKYEFHCHTVMFLGYVISHEGVQIDASKVSIVMEWPIPSDIKDLQWFLFFANFYN